jgi:hypothetical protein
MTDDSIVALILDPNKRGQIIRKRIREACEAAGSPLTTQAIFAWGKLSAGIPPRRVGIVAQVLGMDESQIRPDIFPAQRAKLVKQTAKRGKRAAAARAGNALRRGS